MRSKKFVPPPTLPEENNVTFLTRQCRIVYDMNDTWDGLVCRVQTVEANQTSRDWFTWEEHPVVNSNWKDTGEMLVSTKVVDLLEALITNGYQLNLDPAFRSNKNFFLPERPAEETSTRRPRRKKKL